MLLEFSHPGHVIQPFFCELISSLHLSPLWLEKLCVAGPVVSGSIAQTLAQSIAPASGYPCILSSSWHWPKEKL